MGAGTLDFAQRWGKRLLSSRPGHQPYHGQPQTTGRITSCAGIRKKRVPELQGSSKTPKKSPCRTTSRPPTALYPRSTRPATSAAGNLERMRQHPALLSHFSVLLITRDGLPLFVPRRRYGAWFLSLLGHSGSTRVIISPTWTWTFPCRFGLFTLLTCFLRDFLPAGLGLGLGSN